MNKQIRVPGDETSHVAVKFQGPVGTYLTLASVEYPVMLEKHQLVALVAHGGMFLTVGEKQIVCTDMTKTMTRTKIGCCF